MQHSLGTPMRRMPAEWEPHAATWLAWPQQESDWPGKITPVKWAYVDIIRHLSHSETVHILCHDPTAEKEARSYLEKVPCRADRLQYHTLEHDRGWLRDSAPTLVYGPSGPEWVQWRFNAWAKYENYHLDQHVPSLVSRATGHATVQAVRPDSNEPFVLEGGAIETDGAGTLIVTEECLLSDVQARNPGLSRADYERCFLEYLGIRKTIWLNRGCVGDDTHGHIDDLTRFAREGVVVTVTEHDKNDENHDPLKENLEILRRSTDARGRPLEVFELPMPEPLYFEDVRLPASYANFYIANSVVLVPTFNDPHDRMALNLLAELFPTRKVVGIHAADLVWGFGTLHCLTQQQPADGGSVDAHDRGRNGGSD